MSVTPVAGARRYFYGWNVVAAAGVMALFAWGLGFYGPGVYLAALQRQHGWSAAALSTPVTLYYLAGAVLIARAGETFERLGPRVVVAAGAVAMAAGVVAIGFATRPWHLYPAFLVMALGWGSMSGAAINIIVAPWFMRRRGFAISMAFNGATLGGVLIAPALIVLIGAVGFTPALGLAALVELLVLVPVAGAVLRRGPEELGLGPDGDAPIGVAPHEARTADSRRRADALRTRHFWSVSGPFALALTAQVALITHQVALLGPRLGGGGAARAVGLTTITAVAGRLLTGLFIDRVNRRAVASATMAIQIVGVACLAWSASPLGLYTGCVLFGFGVGNLVTLPGLVLQVEWPRERFAALVALVVAINQVTFASGPTLVGIVRDWAGAYRPALVVCMALQAIAAVWVLVGPRARGVSSGAAAASPPRRWRRA